MDWTVRRATADDAEAVRSVAAAGWRDTYRGLLRPETIEAFLAGPYAIENVRNRIDAHDFFVAEDSGEIAAYGDAVPEAGRVFLAAIYALPARRGYGAGSALLSVMTSRHPALPIDAYVLLGNRKGETFYERRSFDPLESVEADLFGEQVTERRWRRSPQIRAGNSA
jgi:GNAT superfamily N-acetyltransferase